MARVTVEDCEAVVRNRFQLVVLANQRVKQYQNGAPLTIARDNDKDPVVALREIAYQTISIDKLKEATVDSFRQVFENEEEDFVDDDNYDPSSFAVGTEASAVSADDSEDADDQVEPEASVDFSCIIEDNQD